MEDLTQVKINELWTIFRRQLSELLTSAPLDSHPRDQSDTGGTLTASTNSRSTAEARPDDQVQREKDTLAEQPGPSALAAWEPPADTAENDADAGTVVIVSPAGTEFAVPHERCGGKTASFVHSRLGQNLVLHHSKPPRVAHLPPVATLRPCGNVYMTRPSDDQPGGKWTRMCNRYLMPTKEREKCRTDTSTMVMSREESEREGGPLLSPAGRPTGTKGTDIKDEAGSSESDGEVLPMGEQCLSPLSPVGWDRDTESDEGAVRTPPDCHREPFEITPKRQHSLFRSRVHMSVNKSRVLKKADVVPSLQKEQGASVKPVSVKSCAVVVQRESGKTVAEQLKKLQEARGSPLREVCSPGTPLSSMSSTPSRMSTSVLAGDIGKLFEADSLHHKPSRKHSSSESSVDTCCDNWEAEAITSTTVIDAAVPALPKAECDEDLSAVVTTPKDNREENQVSTRKKGLSLLRGSADKRVMVKEMPSSSQPSYPRIALPDVIPCTACGAPISWKQEAIHEHQRLHVLVCERCWKSFNSGSFIVGEDNTENYCTLCGEGGDLVCCDSCIKSFCQVCIRRTSGELFLQNLLQEGSTWNCYCCDSHPLGEQQQQCKDLCGYYRHKRGHSQKKEHDVERCKSDTSTTNLPTVAGGSGCQATLNQEEADDAPTMRKKPGGKERKKFKTPAFIDTDSSSSDGEDSIEVHSDDVVVSDVEDLGKKVKKLARRVVTDSSSESQQEQKVKNDKDGSESEALKKKKKQGRRWRLGSDHMLSSSNSSSDDSTAVNLSHSRKRSWSSSNSELGKRSKKLKHSELAAAVSSDSDGEEDGGKKCGMKLGDAGNNSEMTDVLRGADDSLDNNMAVTYAPFRALGTSDSDEEMPDPKPKSGTAVAESSTDSEDMIVVGRKQSTVQRGTDSGVKEYDPLGPSNKKKRVARGLLSSEEDDAPDKPKDKAPEDGEKGEEGEKQGDSCEKAAGKKRREIREIIADSKLTVPTKEAQKQEKERIERLKARTNKQEGLSAEQKLVLEEDSKTKEAKVEVRRLLVSSLLPHQRDGVRFLYDSCIESLERLQSEGGVRGRGGGCILAHCMGLGKTLQIVAFLDAVMSVKETGISKALILIPVNALHNWMKEFLHWIPNEDRQYEIFMLSMLDAGVKARYHKLKYWHEQGGVMLMGFEMFRNLALGTRLKQKVHKDGFRQFLLDPGPDIIICDEGHVLRSSKSNLSTIVNQVKTMCRIVLTGTPLQNNLLEYYTMVNFVKPNLLGTQKEFVNRFVNPIVNGQCRDSTSQDVRRMKQRAHVLHDMLKASVQRRDYRVLAECLPPKQEYVLAIRLSPIQDQLYRLYLEHTRGYHTASDLFSTFATLLKIWNHPWVLKINEEKREEKRQCEEESEDGESSFIASSSDGEAKRDKKIGPLLSVDRRSSDKPLVGVAPDDVIIIDTDDEQQPSSYAGILRAMKLERGRSSSSVEPLLDDRTDAAVGHFWFKKVLANLENRLDFSGKLVFLVELLKETEKLGEKVLVFSQSLTLLDLIEEFLNRPEYGEWTPGLDYYRLDGSTRPDMRMSFMDQFNGADSPRLRLFIISTRAGSLGVNLVAANRVVIFDACWNPSHDLQSIFRTYRFGQSKPVFVYRLLAKGTMEEKIYDRQVTKQSLSMRVVDEKQIGRHYTQSDLAELFTYSPPPSVAETVIIKGPEVDPVLCSILDRLQPQWIVGYHEHDSLLQHIFDEELSEEDRKQAWENYKAQMDAETGVYNLKAFNQGPETSQGVFSFQPLEQQQQVQGNNSILNVLHSAISKVRTLNKLQEDKVKLTNLLPQVPESNQNILKGELTRLKQQISTEYIAVANSIKAVNKFLTSCHSGNRVLDPQLSHNINHLRSILADELQKMKSSSGVPQPQQQSNGPTYSSMLLQSKSSAIPGTSLPPTFHRGPL